MALIKCTSGKGITLTPFTPSGQVYDSYIAGANFVVGKQYMFSYMDQASGPFGPTEGGTQVFALDKDISGVGHGGSIIFKATANTVKTGTRQWSNFYEVDGDISV